MAFSQKVLMHLSFPQTHEPFVYLNLKIWIFGSYKAVLANQLWPSCPYKPLNCQIWRHPQFLSKFQSPKFKLSVSGKKNVCLFGFMTKTSESSDKNLPILSLEKQCSIFSRSTDSWLLYNTTREKCVLWTSCLDKSGGSVIYSVT